MDQGKNEIGATWDAVLAMRFNYPWKKKSNVLQFQMQISILPQQRSGFNSQKAMVRYDFKWDQNRRIS